MGRNVLHIYNFYNWKKYRTQFCIMHHFYDIIKSYICMDKVSDFVTVIYILINFFDFFSLMINLRSWFVTATGRTLFLQFRESNSIDSKIILMIILYHLTKRFNYLFRIVEGYKLKPPITFELLVFICWEHDNK